jgi:hypothetical protein
MMDSYACIFGPYYNDHVSNAVCLDKILTKLSFCTLDSLPCLLCLMCLKDTCTLEEKMLKDPTRLYAPGRLYHIVERKPFR